MFEQKAKTRVKKKNTKGGQKTAQNTKLSRTEAAVKIKVKKGSQKKSETPQL